jgi:hypothetical protein
MEGWQESVGSGARARSLGPTAPTVSSVLLGRQATRARALCARTVSRQDPSRPTLCQACPPGTAGVAECECVGASSTACTPCAAGKAGLGGLCTLTCQVESVDAEPNENQIACICKPGYYNTSRHGWITCYGLGHDYNDASQSSHPLCAPCAALNCVACSDDGRVVMEPDNAVSLKWCGLLLR